ncbi:hypothetical protein QAD02_017902 [Eretmocerus hayati]|uniref:Uncharacterized protein n=1 Tax=Eretmocerus hayati TaxID=131215 RepID=A0ACC2PJZ5_9HYME|nr:hypothetical protein QAD02_017902 [Eretmocerus hayati]
MSKITASPKRGAFHRKLPNNVDAARTKVQQRSTVFKLWFLKSENMKNSLSEFGDETITESTADKLMRKFDRIHVKARDVISRSSKQEATNKLLLVENGVLRTTNDQIM